jgi:hypothetical protein
MARPFRIGATGGPGLLLQAGPITPTRRRDVPLSKCRRLVSVDDVLQRHGTPSQTEPTSTPEAIQDQQSSGGPSEKYQCTGAPSGREKAKCHLPDAFRSALRTAIELASLTSSGEVWVGA